jgi:hypothetical protein
MTEHDDQPPDPPSSSLMRRWLYGITVALAPVLVTAAGVGLYRQALQAQAIYDMQQLSARDLAETRARQTRLRDDFDAERSDTGKHIANIDNTLTDLQRLIKERLPGKQASTD